MASAINSGSGSLGSSPDRRHCVVFLTMPFYSHNDSLHPGGEMFLVTSC